MRTPLELKLQENFDLNADAAVEAYVLGYIEEHDEVPPEEYVTELVCDHACAVQGVKGCSTELEAIYTEAQHAYTRVVLGGHS